MDQPYQVVATFARKHGDAPLRPIAKCDLKALQGSGRLKEGAFVTSYAPDAPHAPYLPQQVFALTDGGDVVWCWKHETLEAKP